MISIWVVNLAKYNDGEESGRWFDLDICDPEDILKEVLGVDEDGDTNDGETRIDAIDAPDEIQKLIGEYSDLDDLYEFNKWLYKLTNDEFHIFLALCEAADTDNFVHLQELYDRGCYVFLGDFNNMNDAGEEYFRLNCDAKSIPDHMWYYIDFERWANDNTDIVKTSYGYIEVQEG